MSEVKKQVDMFLNLANKYQFKIMVSGISVVKITKEFEPGDRLAFSDIESEAQQILDMIPLKGGSVWGTDGASVGGYSAIQNGKFVMNKSGSTGIRFIKELQKKLIA